jgi:asparagine synthase (glutamine-hydrolysing)
MSSVMNYCYIDYSKQNEMGLSINRSDHYEEIKISSPYANIYFSTHSSDSNSALIENSRFVLLIDGAIESKGITSKKLLELIEKNGIEETLDRVEGVFSLTMYDKEKEQFYLSRDHFGLTPLYYYQNEDILLFSNTLKAFKNASVFKKEINFDTLGQYLQYSYIFQPYTMFVDCYKVKSAHMMRFDLSSREVHDVKYWDIVDYYNKPRVKMSEEEIINKSEALLKSAIIAKVGTSKKIGAFLSGGYDSSAISAILSSDKTIDLYTFTVGFDDCELDEAPFALKIAEHLKINHDEYYFNANYLETLLMRFTEVYDEPLADMATFPTMLISEKSTEKVDVLFGGEGGDEIFASSGFIERVKQFDKIPYPVRLIISNMLKPFSKDIRCSKLSKMMKQKNIENIWNYKDMTLSFATVKELIIPPICEKEMVFKDVHTNASSNLLDKLFPLMFKSYVSDNLLTKFSFAAHAYHLSPKVPYLDRKFVEFLATVDVKVKQKNNTNKYILNKILQKSLPISLIDRPKKGFSVPAAKIVKNELKEILDRYINEERLKKDGIFRVGEVMALKERFMSSSSYYDEQNLWNIFIFQLWYEHWFSE